MDRPPRKRVRREGTFGKFDNTQWPDGSNETIATLARERDELIGQRNRLRDEQLSWQQRAETAERERGEALSKCAELQEEMDVRVSEQTSLLRARITDLRIGAEEDLHVHRELERERDEARAALRRTQWVYDWFCPGGSVPMGMICPVCANHRPEGHKSDCVVGNALAASEQSS